MTVWRLGDALAFPPAEQADPSGLLAVGGDLRPERLVLAYRQGIFPWYEEPPILWFSPDPRMVLVPGELHVARRLRRTLRADAFRLTLDADFAGVIRACAEVPREGQRGTWITPEMIRAYVALHELGLAHSCEAWRGDALVGGVYGVSLGAAFFAESMFHRVRDASKAALTALVWQLAAWDFALVDCQLETGHLARLGARPWPRSRYLAAVEAAVARPTRRGRWQLGAGLIASRLAPDARGGAPPQPTRRSRPAQ